MEVLPSEYVTPGTLHDGSQAAGSLNVAVTETAAAIVTTHGAVPSQPPPDQPAKPKPLVPFALNVTLVPIANGAAQLVPQSMPTGSDETVPVPTVVTLSVTC
ncbi:hypothetical protein BH09MYX1_BH09MYX1_36650 [soil metagenome]